MLFSLNWIYEMEIMKRPNASNDVNGCSQQYYLFPPTRKLGLRSYFLSLIFQPKKRFCKLSDLQIVFHRVLCNNKLQQKKENKIINFQLRFLRKIQVLDIIKIFYLIIKQN